MSEMKKVTLRHPWGETVTQVEIPNDDVGPGIIEHGGRVYVRKTHDVYHEATRLIIGDVVAAA